MKVLADAEVQETIFLTTDQGIHETFTVMHQITPLYQRKIEAEMFTQGAVPLQ
jgi:hypothetical protein